MQKAVAELYDERTETSEEALGDVQDILFNVASLINSQKTGNVEYTAVGFDDTEISNEQINRLYPKVFATVKDSPELWLPAEMAESLKSAKRAESVPQM